MQLLANGRDQVAKSYMQNSLTLHRLVDGTFQFGTGSTASVVKDVKEVAKFHEDVQTEVEKWLQSGGYERGMAAKRSLDLAETSKAMPGSIEALAAEIGGDDLMGKLYALLQAAQKGAPLQKLATLSAEQPLPAGVLRPDKSVKSIVVDDPDEPCIQDDLSDILPDLSLSEALPDLPKASAQKQAPPEPESDLVPESDVIASLQAIAEGLRSMTERIDRLEQKPKPYPKGKPRPSRSKHAKKAD